MFTIKADPIYGLVEIKLSGFMPLDEVRDLGREMEAAIEQVVQVRGSYAELLDISEFAIQTAEVAEAMERVKQKLPYIPDRAAIVTGAAAARIQAKRLKPRTTLIFDQREQALAWLISKPRASHAA